MRKLNLMPFVLVLVVLFLAVGCSSNESKAEKLVDAADGEYLQGNLNYESVISSYIEAYHLVNFDAYKDRIVDLINEQNTLISIRECLVSLDELSKNIQDTVDGYRFDDIDELNAYIHKTESEIMTVLDYLSQLGCNSTKINGYISDVINSNEYYEIVTELKDTEYPILAERLYNLAHLYDFPDSFKPYSISDEEFRLFGLSERLSLEMFSQGRTLTENYDDAYTENSLIIEGRDFSDGVAWVRFASNWACVDKEGTVLFELDAGSEPTTDFRGGIAIVGEDKIIDKTGNVVYGNAAGQYDSIVLSTENFNGLVFVKKYIDTFELTEERIGIIDASGDWYLEPVNYMQHPEHLGDGMYRIWTVSKGYESESCIYNSQAKNFFNLYKPNRNIALGLNYTDGYSIHVGGEHVGYPNYSIDKSGNYTEFSCEEVDYEGIVKNGLHTISKKAQYSDGIFFGYGEDKYNNHKGKFYDKEGKVVLDVSHLNVTNEPYFVDGYCLLALKNNQGSEYFTVIDKLGNMIFEPVKFLPHGNLRDGLYWTMENGIYTYRNVQGTAVFTLPEHIEAAYDFSEGLLRVESPSGTYYVDTNGNTVFGSVGEMSSITSYDGDYERLNKFLTFLVEKEGQMYDIEPLEFDAHNCDLNELLQFVFVKTAWITNTDDDFVKEYRATTSDMNTLAQSIFGIDVSEYLDANIAVSYGLLEYVYDSRSPYYYQIIEWGARGTYDTWAETESVTENGDGSLTVVAGIYTSVNPEERKVLNRKIIAIVIPVDEGYQLLSFKNND